MQMRTAGLFIALILGAAGAQKPAATLTPAAVLLLTDATHVDETLLSTALVDADPNVRAAAARVIGVYSVAPLAAAVDAALAKETDSRAGTELARALLFLRGTAASDPVQAAAKRLGPSLTRVLDVWQKRATTAQVSPVPNDLMFSRTVDVWLPGLLGGLAAAAQCRLGDEVKFGAARLTYSGDGRARLVETDHADLSKQCASVLAALARTTLAEDDKPAADGLQQWVLVPFSRAYARCTEDIDADAVSAKPSPGATPKKIKDVRPRYPREMQSQRTSGFVMAEGVVSSRGCLVNLRIIRSPAVPFEAEALRAMSEWEFEPARQDGRPVAVRTTITTTFSIR